MQDGVYLLESKAICSRVIKEFGRAVAKRKTIGRVIGLEVWRLMRKFGS